MKKAKGIVIAAIVILLAVIILGGSMYSVQENEYACVVRFSKIIQTTDTAGLHFKVPFLDSVKSFTKAAMLYDCIDNSKLFTCAAEKGSRSDMNVTFRSASEELDAKFVAEATAAGFTNLKGHRSVGGMRASIYNAMPVEGVEKLVDFINAFDKNN